MWLQNVRYSLQNNNLGNEIKMMLLVTNCRRLHTTGSD